MKRYLTTGIITLLPFLIISALAQSLSTGIAAAGGPASRRELSFEERVGYQKAVEDVLWKHRLWPSENPYPKPALEEVMPLSMIREKVETMLRRSDALEKRYDSSITGEQLQAEIERIARETRSPDLLRELWEALDNDPVLIAECLARPLLADRLIRRFYEADDRIHGDLRRRAEAELNDCSTPAAMKSLGGQYSETEWIRSESSDRAGKPARNLTGERKVELLQPEWTETVSTLRRAFESPASSRSDECLSCPKLDSHSVDQTAEIETLPLMQVSNLQEDNHRFYAAAVLSTGEDRITTAIVEWRKMDFERWWASSKDEFESRTAEVSYDYQMPRIAATNCANDTWKPTKALPAGISGTTAVWTGAEMIIWGGYSLAGSGVSSGARYNPATDSWTTVSMLDAPRRRIDHTAVWTGAEMIIWGGCDTSGHLCGLSDGGRYNPATDTWTHITTANAPSGRRNHSAVWTGSLMIVWGGCTPSFDGRCPTLNTGGIYDPVADRWTATNLSGAPSARTAHRAVWAGNVMVVWGGDSGSTGGRFDPDTNTWTPTSTINVPSARGAHTMVWTGSEVIVWGGTFNSSYLNTGGRYNPATDIWKPVSGAGAPTPRSSHTSVWTGTEMIVWGGWDASFTRFNTGGRYNPATDNWTSTSTTNAPSARAGHRAVWTGSLMVIWGGMSDKSGGRYNPATDSWTPTDNDDAIDARENHGAVWTGTEMLVWGGRSALWGDVNTGGRYSPATDTWQPTSTINAPYGRYVDSLVWTGMEMIVWSGGYISICEGSGDGGRYNPTTDTWAPVSTAGAPNRRTGHTAIWTGTEMIVWGGVCDGAYNTGGRYNPSTDTWQATRTTGAPQARYLHTAVWSGNEMIVWGGVGFGTGVYFNNGGRYNPVTDTWSSTSIANAPTGRTGHRAVWTGTEMIVWGGWVYGTPSVYFNSGGRYNPAIDSWQATTTTGAPEARTGHTSVWTGTEMIVWGGVAGTSSLSPVYSTGGRYNPSSDRWAPTNTASAPSARTNHTAVWTGNEMIVWGGFQQSIGSSYTSQGGRYCATAVPSFNISASPFSTTVNAGSSTAITLTVSSSNGFMSPVSLDIPGTPAGVTGTFAPNPVTPAPNGTASASLTITVAPDVAGGAYSFIVAGTSGGIRRTTLIKLNVPPPPDFYLTAYPELLSATQGESTTTQPRIWSLNGFNSPVNLGCAGLPAGVSCSFFFNPQSPPANGSVTNSMTLSVAASVPPGIYSFQLTGTSGGLARSFPLQLTVLPSGCSYSIAPTYAPDFTDSGGTATLTVTTGNGCSWQAVSNADWITITSGSSGTGSGAVTYTVAPNTGNARLVRMTIAGQSYQVYQTGPSCPLAIWPASHSFVAEGWTGVVSVSGSLACGWAATSNASWITILSGNAGNGSGGVTYTVAPNTGSTIRTGTMTIAGQTFTVYQAPRFSDVTPAHPYYTDISKIAARGITVGCAAGVYCPDGLVTREQMAVFIERALGIFVPPAPAGQTFTDVSPSRFGYAHIEDFATRGITVGCGAGVYCPDGLVTRQEIATFLERAAGRPNPPVPLSQRFSDVETFRWSYSFVESFVSNGMDRGVMDVVRRGCNPDGAHYCPDQPITRAEMAAFLVLAFNLQ